MATTHTRLRTKRHETSRSPALERYEQKRDFSITREPAAGRQRRKKQSTSALRYPEALGPRLNYAFRLEFDGVLLCWAVPKGPSYDPAEKRIAVHIEDHPLDYASFEGDIPPKAIRRRAHPRLTSQGHSLLRRIR
ncbi:DNA polymerase ligase N-terminal domain-containing protein [Cupriavidus sp. LEh21]|nr:MULTISPECIES: DNA polymerase ligase N-terminal domain-containing protein [unclassified Cupriavidus]MDK2657495.1 DNA polymerase ligase N-terminal domain-containing protein [Cupriavidus sp. LEh21]